MLRSIVHYPIALAGPLALLAVLAVAGLVTLAWARGLLSITGLLLAVVWVPLQLGTAAALGQCLWWVLLVARPDYAQNPFLYRPLLYQLAVAVLAAVALLAWYLLVRRRLGPVALASAGMGWLSCLGVLTAALTPGTSHLFTLPTLGCAAGGLVALLAARSHPAWPAVALTLGISAAVVLLMPLALDSVDAAGLATSGAVAALLVLFGLTLLPLIEPFLPAGQALGRRRATRWALTGVTLVATLTGTGLAVDRVDATHPRRSDLMYLLDADTGQASWLSRDAEPGGWTRQYVAARSDDPERAVGLADGPVWLGPAPALRASGPEVTLRSRQNDRPEQGGAISLHVSSARSASSVVLRINQPVDEVTVTAPGLAPTGLRLTGTGPGAWPTEVSFGDLPAEGIDVGLLIRRKGPIQIAAYDLTPGLEDVPGFVPRPAGVERSRYQSGDIVVVVRTYRF